MSETIRVGKENIQTTTISEHPLSNELLELVYIHDSYFFDRYKDMVECSRLFDILSNARPKVKSL